MPIRAALKRVVAIPAASMLNICLGSNAMRQYYRSRAGATSKSPNAIPPWTTLTS